MKDIILRRKTEEAYIVQHQIGLGGIIKGQVGLEVEVEGTKFPKPPGSEGTSRPVPLPETKFWSYVHDGSLRGADNAEYVLTSPVSFADVPVAVDELFARLDKHGSKIADSNRTSIHVHLNVRDFFLNRLTSLMCLWIIFEGPLTEWCGENRVGNLFCLGTKDTAGTISHLKRFIKSNMSYGLRDGLHYSGMNAHAVMKKGSLEFRTLQGTREPNVIKTWVRILKRLYDLSAEYSDPRTIVEGFSGMGPLAFFDHLLGEVASDVRQGIGMNEDTLRESLYDNMRLAQDLAYAKDWSRFKPIEIKTDVFGRTKGKKPTIVSDTIDMEEVQEWAEDNEVPVEIALNNFIQMQAQNTTQGGIAGTQIFNAQPWTVEPPQW